MIGLTHRELSTLPARSGSHYPILGITLYKLYNNEYYSLN